MQMLQGSPTIQNELSLSAPFFAMGLPSGDQQTPHISQFESTPSLSDESSLSVAMSHSPQDTMYSTSQIQFDSSYLDQASDDDGSPVTVPSKRGSKNHVSSACINCKRAHLACDVSRPCKRCVTLGKQDSCHDIAHKKRGRPKLRDKASMMQSHFLANERKYEIMYDAIQTPAFATSAQRVNRPQQAAQPQQAGRIAFVHQTLEEFHEQQQQQQREEEQIHERIIRRSFSRGSEAAADKPQHAHPMHQHSASPALQEVSVPIHPTQPLNEHTHYLSPIDFNPSNLLAEGPDLNEASMSPILINGAMDMPSPAREHPPVSSGGPPPQVTVFMSMEVCCARASDEVTEAWGYYPQELAHRSFYDFVSPKDTDRLAQLHRLLLDNIQNVADQATNGSQKRHARLPRAERTTSDLFYDTLPERLMYVAKGSNTYSDTLHIKRRDGDMELFNFKVYLGGGFGADLFNPDTYSKLYIVAILSKHQYAVQASYEPQQLASTRSNFTETGADSPMACDSPQNGGPSSMDMTGSSTPELKNLSSGGSTLGSSDHDRFQVFRKPSMSLTTPFSSGFSNTSMVESRISKSPPRLGGINYLNSAAVPNQAPVSPKINIAPTTNQQGLLNTSSTRFFPKTGNSGNPTTNASTSFRTMSMNPITSALPDTSYYSRRSDPFVITPPNRFAPTPLGRASASYTHPTTQYFLQTSSSTLNAAASAAQTKTRGGPGYSFTPMSGARGADDLAPNDRATGKTESNPKMEMSITSLLC
ncbi:hypothetical protein K450DRAFT_220354 [Umbelopsis ramanniana AG]|uniref:Zn(2)-C6 fungal-type domain-containing protein n=1 Tax=Umbelopsis ramanniana AG TaxID=1314678 RepID=A0AAD5EIE3_UMBRA|nr:uncharacterized protein K450DRAFT_220354 [Umbelopsis ramanniana AG]KAI8583872.1 hypothetical protein K450DRAFT_220354 [Umbelopsis ramanniana AG]